MTRLQKPFPKLGRSAKAKHSMALGLCLAAGLWVQGVAAQTDIPPKTPDFVMAATQSDQYEIDAGRVAVTQSRNPQVRQFAQEMIDDHTRLSSDLRQAAISAGLKPPPPSLSGDGAAMLATLQSLRGIDFDKAYARQQVLAHHSALAVEQSYAASGADPVIQKAAQAALPTIRHHLEMAGQLKTSLGGM